MKRQNLAILIAVLSFMFWIAQNFYFGWNKESQSALESFCDWLTIFGYFMAFLIKPISQTDNYTINTSKCDVKIVRK